MLKNADVGMQRVLSPCALRTARCFLRRALAFSFSLHRCCARCTPTRNHHPPPPKTGATDEQCEFPVAYASGVKGVAGPAPDALAEDLSPLFDAIIKEVRAVHVFCFLIPVLLLVFVRCCMSTAGPVWTPSSRPF